MTLLCCYLLVLSQHIYYVPKYNTWRRHTESRRRGVEALQFDTQRL